MSNFNKYLFLFIMNLSLAETIKNCSSFNNLRIYTLDKVMINGQEFHNIKINITKTYNPNKYIVNEKEIIDYYILEGTINYIQNNESKNIKITYCYNIILVEEPTKSNVILSTDPVNGEESLLIYILSENNTNYVPKEGELNYSIPINTKKITIKSKLDRPITQYKRSETSIGTPIDEFSKQKLFGQKRERPYKDDDSLNSKHMKISRGSSNDEFSKQKSPGQKRERLDEDEDSLRSKHNKISEETQNDDSSNQKLPYDRSIDKAILEITQIPTDSKTLEDKLIIRKCDELMPGLYELKNGMKIKIFKTSPNLYINKIIYIEGFLIRDDLFKIPIYSCTTNENHLELKLIRRFIYDKIIRRSIEQLDPLKYIISNDLIKSYHNNDTRYNDLKYKQDTIINSGCYILKEINSLLGRRPIILKGTITLNIIEVEQTIAEEIFTNYFGDINILDKNYALSGCKTISISENGGNDSQIEYYNQFNKESIPFNLLDIDFANDQKLPNILHDKLLTREIDQTITNSDSSNVETIDDLLLRLKINQ